MISPAGSWGRGDGRGQAERVAPLPKAVIPIGQAYGGAEEARPIGYRLWKKKPRPAYRLSTWYEKISFPKKYMKK
jgi:hypothetical protein